MARFKPILKERQEKAKTQFKRTPKNKATVINILKKAIREGNIKGKVICIDPQNIDFEKISKDYNTNDASHIIFLQIVEGGHIAVLGAGKDISFTKKVSKKGTWSIISKIDGIKWKTDEVILIPISKLCGIGIQNVRNILECRNGVEHYLGKYLIDHNIPILNCDQHLNYSEKFWNKCLENNYDIC